jgi:hypothetical protein
MTGQYAEGFLKASEPARQLGVSLKSIRRWYGRGIIPGIRIGGVVRFDLPAVLEAIGAPGRKGVAR